MKRSLFAFVLFCTFSLTAQYSISGTFTPAKNYRWLIVYLLKAGEQAYTADTAIKDGKFSLSLPAHSAPGTYRLVYAVPQEEFYFDVIYSGKEDIQLKFDAEKGVSFTASKENRIFNAYFRQINAAKQAFIDFYQAGKTDKDAFERLSERLRTVQEGYEKESAGLLAHNFIAANRPYIPSEYETGQIYWQHKKDQYFRHLDLTDPILQGSAFLKDKLTNYIFTAILNENRSQEETENLLCQNVDKVASELKDTEESYRFHIFHSLHNTAMAGRFNVTADYILDTYMRPLAQVTGNQKTIDQLEIQHRLQIGSIPPDIIWKDDNVTKRLSEMDGAECYVLIFWSSTCSHCLHQLPPLHEELKKFPDVKVLAIGLEDGKKSWEKESAKLPGFVHVLGLDHWDNRYAELYEIRRTPTFFVLDSDKRIIAKPKSDKELLTFLNEGT
ncbi:thioredoxin-like domain-containing protein [Pricia sp. S334]|uniref:Thioredoxin-like domain-containing protein n=1 Tax=Pricia mediterranea TaxID=3076079 RepID=A0ABU3L486_9FLAO|nr:thioredoxin-like domain-containing protein [Pricia sp. S334]MDT7828560.1 thioredoxin-like domain-containing protein [Pricia sp. S334]